MHVRPADEIDRRLLAALRADARTSQVRLGEIVRLSRNAVRQRVERLERDGYIRGYTIVESARDPARVDAILLVHRSDRVRGADVITALRAIPEIVRCDVVAGELDLIVQLEASDPARVQEIWSEVTQLPGVRDITTALTLQTVIDRRRDRQPAERPG